MTTAPLAIVKVRLSEFVGRVSGQHERVTLTVHGQPSAVLLSVEDLESLEETLAVLADGDSVRRMTASEAQLGRGDIVTAECLAETMAARRSTG